jgi:hypothetical protein
VRFSCRDGVREYSVAELEHIQRQLVGGFSMRSHSPVHAVTHLCERCSQSNPACWRIFCQIRHGTLVMKLCLSLGQKE